MNKGTAQKLCTTKYIDKYTVGQQVIDRKNNRMVVVVSIQRIREDNAWVYDVYVKEYHE